MSLHSERYGLHFVVTGQNEQLKKILPKPSPKHHRFQMTATTKCCTEFAVAVINGESTTLQDLQSGVTVDVPKGIKGILWQKIHTKFSRFLHIVPDEECYAGPVVELHLVPFLEEETGQQQYKIKIPHCLNTEGERSSLKVRSGDVRKKVDFQELKNKQKASGKIPFYEVDETHVIIYTNHFTEYICSSCSKTCLSYIMAFPFGTIFPGEDGDNTQIKVEVYLCCSLYNIEDFKTVSFCFKNLK